MGAEADLAHEVGDHAVEGGALEAKAGLAYIRQGRGSYRCGRGHRRQKRSSL